MLNRELDEESLPNMWSVKVRSQKPVRPVCKTEYVFFAYNMKH